MSRMTEMIMHMPVALVVLLVFAVVGLAGVLAAVRVVAARDHAGPRPGHREDIP